MANQTIDPILFPTPIQLPKRPTPSQPSAGRTGDHSPFARLLDAKSTTGELSFSRHAQERLQSRGIILSEQELGQLAGAVDSLAQKGGKDSLVMLGRSAFVVSVPNRTVVTAMDRDNMRGNIVTNIDSAVVV